MSKGEDSRVDTLVGGKYRVIERIGSGGMGDVYRAVNEMVGRPVALKLMKADAAADPTLVERFLREARVANQIRHPNVCDILDAGKDDTGVPFLVVELLAGETLGALAARKGGRLSVNALLEILLPAIDAISEAHARGVTHRDLKPDNIFLVGDREHPTPKVLDFGISKLSSSDAARTEVGLMLGTPAYMPPEQIQGARDADCRSDVWALGITMFELLTGGFPFPANDASSLFHAVATKDAPSLRTIDASLPEGLATIVARCLRRVPAERYPSAAELARDIRLFREGADPEPTQKRSAPPPSFLIVDDVPELRAPDPSSLPRTPRLPSIRPLRGSDGLVRTFEEPLSGLVLAPTVPLVLARRPRIFEERRRQPDMSGIIAIAAVSSIGLAVLGVLMTVAHRPDGWPVAAFFADAKPPVATVIHGAAAFLCAVLAIGQARRAVLQWKGILGGGYGRAALGGAIGAALLFAAVELLAPVW